MLLLTSPHSFSCSLADESGWGSASFFLASSRLLGCIPYIVSAITWHLPSLTASFHWKYLYSSTFPSPLWYNYRENSWVLGKEIINVVLSTAWWLYTTKLISCSKHQKQSARSRQKEELPGKMHRSGLLHAQLYAHTFCHWGCQSWNSIFISMHFCVV